MHAARTRWIFALACLVLGACSANRLGHRRPGEEGVLPVDVTLSTSEIMAGWQREGDYLVSPPLEEEAAASRVGVLVQLQGDGEFPAFEARATESGEATGEWVALGATYSEGDHHVGMAELGTISTGAQIRIPIAAVDGISSLVWNATIPEQLDTEEAPPPEDVAAASAPLTSDLMGLGIVTRSAWGAVATRCTARDSRRYRMAVHYTDTGSVDPARQLRSIQHYHMDTRGWCDVGYHFLVGVDGQIFEGRPIELLGAHVASNNTGNIGVSFIGCFHSTGCAGMGPTTPPDVMLESGGRLLGTLSRLYGITLDRTSVKGHRDHAGASTDCPGDYLYARIDRLLAIGHDHRLGETSPPPVTDPTPPPPASCGGLTCGPCAAAAGCGYCASQGACLSAGSACTWAGSVGTSACTDTLYPCSTATCWNPTATFTSCGGYTHAEDFTSGSYSVHRYWAHLYAGGVTTITLSRTSGTFSPALLISDRSGRVAYGGEVASLHPSVQIVSARPGRGDTAASVALTATSDLDVYVYVTDWAVLDGAFRGRVSTTAHYSLTANEDCGVSMPPPATGTDPYAGLTQSGAEVPRAGLTNPTLRSTLGLSVEPYGSVVDYHGQSWVSGRVSWFGGPSDTGVGPTETVAISGEVARSLNSPLHPDAATLASHPERYYYIAMRFSYSPMSTSFWRTARLVIANPRTGARVVVRPADWGPNTSTGRVMDLSPQVMADLGLTTDDTAVIAFARPGTALGVVH